MKTSFARWWWLAVLTGMISLAGIANHELWTPDEPREAAIALAMRRSGDVIVPRLAGAPFVEKPPLAYIASAMALRLFEPALGPTAALRLSSALWGLGTILMTFLLARRLAGPAAAGWAAAALAIMPGFVQVTHWLLVDNALMFFITAAVWLFSEAYLKPRPGLLPAAGLAVAAAFLVKGLIGPLIIGLAWLGLAGVVCRRGDWRGWLTRRGIIWHLAAGLLAALVAGAWMLSLRVYGGPDLWREWFWDNHFGRFTGQAHHLGHIRGPFYYAGALTVAALPWLAFWADGLWRAWRNRRHGPWRDWRPPDAWLPMLCWFIGGLGLLTVSSTKREIYLSMLLPAAAVITGMLLKETPAAWVRLWWRGWRYLAILVLLAAAVTPAAAFGLGWLPGCAALAYSIAALPVLAAAWCLARRVPALPELPRGLALTALAYILALTVAPPALDRVKNYAPAFQALAAAIPADRHARTGGWNFDETTRASFYYYCDLVFPPVSDTSELSRVLAGRHPRLTGLVAPGRHFPPAGDLPAWTVRARAAPDGRRGKRELLYVTGATH